MAYSYVHYTGDGATTLFTIPFPYLEQSHVQVYVNGDLKTINTDYTFPTDASIQFVVAPADGALVELRRSSSLASRLVDHENGAKLIAETLDRDANQIFYLTQEAYDQANRSINVGETTGHWDARGMKIKNVGYPEDDTDAATVAYVNDAIEELSTSPGGGATEIRVANREALAALSTTDATAAIIYGEGGRNGMFIWTPGDLSAKVASDPKQGIYIAPDSDPTGASGAWVRQYDGVLNAKWFGALGNNSADDSEALAAAAAMIGESGGALYIPPGRYRCSTRPFDFIDRRGIRIFGETNTDHLTTPFATELLYTGTGSEGGLIRAQGVSGLEISHMGLCYTDLSYTGDLIDLRKGNGVMFTSAVHIHHFRAGCTLVGNADNPGANSIINVSDTLKCLIEDGFILNGRCGIRGAASGQVSNGIYIKNVWFDEHLNTPILAGGYGWTIENCISEPPIAGSDGARFLEISARNLESLNFIGNQLDDAGTAGTWILCDEGAILGGHIAGNFFQGNSGHVSMNLGLSKSLSIIGNLFQYGRILGANATDVVCLGNRTTGSSQLFEPGQLPTGNSVVDNLDGNGVRFIGDVLHYGDTYFLGSLAVSVSGAAVFNHEWVQMANLPTSDPGVEGRLWNDGGTLKVSAGSP